MNSIGEIIAVAISVVACIIGLGYVFKLMHNASKYEVAFFIYDTSTQKMTVTYRDGTVAVFFGRDDQWSYVTGRPCGKSMTQFLAELYAEHEQNY